MPSTPPTSAAPLVPSGATRAGLGLFVEGYARASPSPQRGEVGRGDERAYARHTSHPTVSREFPQRSSLAGGPAACTFHSLGPAIEKLSALFRIEAWLKALFRTIEKLR